MRLKQRFNRESPELAQETQTFMHQAVLELKSKGMKMFFVNQRNDDQGGTEVTVTGLDAVDKPMLASMLDSGFSILDTHSFGFEAMKVDGFEATSPTEIAANVDSHAKTEVLVLPDDDEPTTETLKAHDSFLPFSFEDAAAAQAFVSEVFNCTLGEEDAHFLYQWGLEQPDLAENAEPMSRYQKILAQIEPHYADDVTAFVRDTMISAQGRWLYYAHELRPLKQKVKDPQALHTLLKEKVNANATASDARLIFSLISEKPRPPKAAIANMINAIEEAIKKYLPHFLEGDSPQALISRLDPGHSPDPCVI